MEEKNCGNWPSAITPEFVTESTKFFPSLFAEDETLYWIERRASEQGRSTIVAQSLSKSNPIEMLLKPFSAKSHIYEYGGRAIFVQNKVIYFTNAEDQNLYRLAEKGKPELLFADPHLRFGDFIVDKKSEWLISVCEDLREDAAVKHFLARISIEAKTLEVLISGDHFYASPALSEDGSLLAYISWNDPFMSWDRSRLSLKNLVTGETSVYGDEAPQSLMQPTFGPDGKLYCLSDKNGFWNLYREKEGHLALVSKIEGDIGEPIWQLGSTHYTFLRGLDGEGSLHSAVIYIEKGIDKLGLIDLQSGEFQEIHLPYTALSNLVALGEKLYFIGASPIDTPSIIELDMVTLEQNIIAESRSLSIDPRYLSQGEPVEIESDDKKTIYGIFYAPSHPDFTPRLTEKPPLIVRAHGGPTAHSRLSLNLEIQYWTSRGFAYLEVNYRGSSGFGRIYREALIHRFGPLDASDCISAAKAMASSGRVDGSRMVIRGTSSGGYTALHALRGESPFKGAAIYYPVTDLLAPILAGFEGSYYEQLIGPCGSSAYLERSPLHFVSEIKTPLLVFQGGDDKIVPAATTEAFVQKAKEAGLDVTYQLFPGEGHSFKGQETLSKCLEGERLFYEKLLSLNGENEERSGS